MDADTALRRIGYVNLPAQFEEERTEIMQAVEGVFRRGDFIGGEAVGKLELELSAYLGTPHVVTLNSGTDALSLAMKALGIGPGDEVITPPNSFVASTASIVAVGATPVFADVLPDQNIDPAAVEAVVTPRTKAIMPVHLTGRMADMNPLMKIADKHSLAVIEDSAQSVGSTYDGRMSGTIGTFGCFSAHPLKNLNAAGDAGFVVTADAELAARIRRLRNHGLINRSDVSEWGTVSRLDTLQAEVLRIRLRHLPSVILRRRRNATQYRQELAGVPLFIPPCRDIEFNTFHTFVVQTDRRNELQKFLATKGIETTIHYPVPIHLQPAAAHLGHRRGAFAVTERQAEEILTLPVNQFLSEFDISYICSSIREYFA
ncbi:DegT/DnrJ/EryC1/StrS family aminotransferase [Bradyrhizobium canariense]|uniref:dTDP-4-amino-4,6-dideoxygalactose transaminase n=1 Tax=Bradyrhizobium canariense TaxID=255045 RepID=A0A1H1QGL9_9BRAD|nr:DegT/DnrJ/EryC1/StrS family aminotransferase [Bradyrhizobium canariense]SDS22447.1 dTDP-4-amino-4,6-dideoxygalactose transaminase [Bradyrhizobium canariense]